MDTIMVDDEVDNCWNQDSIGKVFTRTMKKSNTNVYGCQNDEKCLRCVEKAKGFEGKIQDFTK